VSADDVVLRASGIGKRYRLGRKRSLQPRTLRETLTAYLGGRAPGGSDGDATTHWALKDVAFDVRAGQLVGIIGRNGAGKSTLLRILSRITEPTEGRVEIRGRVGSLLDVGTGFHMELSGRENIFLNGAILGMKRAEIASRFDEIVAFAGTEMFLDTPVKYYSSGMYMRLAFAVAAHLETDTLIVDEVLAVGDAAFQKKCLGKMGDVARRGRTVLFVSHNLGALRSLCTRGIVLAQGSVGFEGSTDAAIAYYLANVAPSGDEGGQVVFPAPGLAFGALTVHAVRAVDDAGQARALFDGSDRIRVEVDYEMIAAIRGLRAVLLVSTQDGEVAFQSTDHSTREADLPPGRYRTSCVIPGGLLNGRVYVVELGFDVPSVQQVAPRRPYVTFAVSAAGNQTTAEPWPGVVCPTLDWATRPV
jgi:lipopolysaccharide transport system ATP-binding protein